MITKMLMMTNKGHKHLLRRKKKKTQRMKPSRKYRVVYSSLSGIGGVFSIIILF